MTRVAPLVRGRPRHAAAGRDAGRAARAAGRRQRRQRGPAARPGAGLAGLLRTGWSGYVETDGTLQLPDADRFSDVGALFGERTRMRVWWRDADHWRVDQLLVAGETDLVHEGDRTTEWDYEHARGHGQPRPRHPAAAHRRPAAAGAGRTGCCAGSTTSDVSRIAGPPGRRHQRARAAAGAVLGRCRASTTSTCGSTRTPAYRCASRCTPTAATRPAFTSALPRLLRPSARAPTTVDFTRHPDTDVRLRRRARHRRRRQPVRTRCGRPRPSPGWRKTSASDGAVGVYGRGATQVIAIPLRDREADALREQLDVTPGVEHARPTGRS